MSGGHATTTMKKNGLEPCGWITIIEEENQQCTRHCQDRCVSIYKKHDTAPLTAPASLEMLKKNKRKMVAP
jgi:hypothetical protein